MMFWGIFQTHSLVLENPDLVKNLGYQCKLLLYRYLSAKVGLFAGKLMQHHIYALEFMDDVEAVLAPP